MEADLAKHVGEDVTVGFTVTITKGLYARMEGQVVDILDTGDILVRFQMRSIDLLASVPRSFAVPTDGGS